MTDLAIIHSAVMDMFECVSSSHSLCMVDHSRLDYGQYSNHRTLRPYSTIIEGVNWYLNQPESEHLPEELIIHLVSFNFGISVDDAIQEVENSTVKESGIVDLS
jgi:hypothetical protein